MDEEQMTQELLARIFMHKRVILGSVLADKYIREESQSAVQLPPVQMKKQAQDYTDAVIHQAYTNGTFDMLYNSAWEEVKYKLPEHLNICTLQL